MKQALRQHAAAVGFAGLLVVLGAWVAPALGSIVVLPPILAYLAGPGSHWLVVLGLVILAVSLALRSGRLKRAAAQAAAALEGGSVLGWILLAVLVAVGFARVPEPRRGLVDISGDEPKYLRIAMSLVNDTDVDIAGGRETPPDLRLRMRQLASLAHSTREALVSLVDRPESLPGTAGTPATGASTGFTAARITCSHRVCRRSSPSSSVRARRLDQEQSGPSRRSVPRLLLDSRGDRDLQARPRRARLARWRAGATTLLFATAPVFVGGYHLYPESVALLLFPFCFRLLRASDRPLRAWSALAAGSVAGGLWWIHPKFMAPSLALLAIGLLRPRASRCSRLLIAETFALAAGSSLLYVSRITGLFRPQGLYIRQAQEYVGFPLLRDGRLPQRAGERPGRRPRRHPRPRPGPPAGGRRAADRGLLTSEVDARAGRRVRGRVAGPPPCTGEHPWAPRHASSCRLPSHRCCCSRSPCARSGDARACWCRCSCSPWCRSGSPREPRPTGAWPSNPYGEVLLPRPPSRTSPATCRRGQPHRDHRCAAGLAAARNRRCSGTSLAPPRITRHDARVRGAHAPSRNRSARLRPARPRTPGRERWWRQHRCEPRRRRQARHPRPSRGLPCQGAGARLAGRDRVVQRRQLVQRDER